MVDHYSLASNRWILKAFWPVYFKGVISTKLPIIYYRLEWSLVNSLLSVDIVDKSTQAKMFASSIIDLAGVRQRADISEISLARWAPSSNTTNKLLFQAVVVRWWWWWRCEMEIDIPESPNTWQTTFEFDRTSVWFYLKTTDWRQVYESPRSPQL